MHYTQNTRSFDKKAEKLFNFKLLEKIDFKLLFIFLAIFCIGLTCMYSVDKGSFGYFFKRQFFVFIIFMPLIFILCCALNMRYIVKLSYLYYYLMVFLLLIVFGVGHVAMGARRWIDFGFINIQPSEFVKTAVILCLARYFHFVKIDVTGNLKNYIIPLIIVAIPSGLVILQPDLGTGTIIFAIGLCLFFISGLHYRYIIIMALCGLVSLPFVWTKMHDYQKQRVLVFLNPTSDPFGSGYNIIQSQIAVGSGGFFGKGMLNGSQSQLEFLPENHTDFIFTHFTEEFGFLGAIVLFALYSFLVWYCYKIGLEAESHFTRIAVLGIALNFFINIFVNVGMAIGILPVVGSPLPLMSYGGSFLVSNIINFSLLMNFAINKNVEIDTSYKTFI